MIPAERHLMRPQEAKARMTEALMRVRPTAAQTLSSITAAVHRKRQKRMFLPLRMRLRAAKAAIRLRMRHPAANKQRAQAARLKAEPESDPCYIKLQRDMIVI